MVRAKPVTGTEPRLTGRGDTKVWLREEFAFYSTQIQGPALARPSLWFPACPSDSIG
jgi:hypothetical protein